jgi:cell division transport system permease protein
MRAWRSFIRTFKYQTSMQIATLSVLVGTFTINALFALVHQNLQTILTRWGSEVKVSVYLKDQAATPDITRVGEFLKSSEFANQVDYLSKDQAAQRFREKIGQISPGMFTDSEFINPLPASFEIVLKKGIGRNSEYSDLVKFAKEVAGFSGVEEVSYGQGWVENYAAVLKVFSWTSAFLVFVLFMGGLFVIGNSIRNSVAQRRDEISVLELFGATKWMIQWPFIFEGAFMGLLASILSIALSYVLFSWQAELIGSNLNFWGFTSSLQFLSAARVATVIALGTGLGAMGAYFCVRQVNTGWAAAETSEKW